MMIKTYKYKSHPTKTQTKYLEKYLVCVNTQLLPAYHPASKPNITANDDDTNVDKNTVTKKKMNIPNKNLMIIPFYS